MDKDLIELLRKAYNEGVMYEATLSAACSFENFLEYIESEALNMRKVMQQSEQLKPHQECYKTGKECKYNCEGLCKDSY